MRFLSDIFIRTYVNGFMINNLHQVNSLISFESIVCRRFETALYVDNPPEVNPTLV